MRIDLSGRVFLVTGGATGIGLAVARCARRCGASVAILDRDLNATQRACTELDALPLGGEVQVEADCQRAVEQVVANFGGIHVLVNNAGVFESLTGTAKQDLADWRRVIDINLQGTFLMARAAIRAMTAQRAGAIINIASVAGLAGFRASNAYGVSKAGVAMMTRTMALDVASKGIRVNAVAPGFVETAMTESIQNDLGIDRSVFERRTPLGRFATADELANVVVFLASDLASFITGAIVPVDGGWTAFGGAGHAS